jgi:capsular exopolysaccharide synthesis family protein
MSQIFDGLRRLEAERTGSHVSQLPGAIELLRQSESQIASRWESDVPPDCPTAAKAAKSSAPIVATSASMPSAASATTGAERLPEFMTLKVSIAPQSRLACLTDIGSPVSEAFRLLSVRLRHLARTRTLKTLLVTSTIPQEGKSMIAANLACALAQSTQQRILLLEGDLRRPSLSRTFGLGRNLGLSEYLQGDQGLAESIYFLEGPGFWMLPSGGAPSRALELLQSRKISALADRLAAVFDWILIDSPPVLPLADTSVWMRLADGILLVVRPGTTEKRQLERGLEAFEPKKIIGTVVNSSKHPSDGYYYYRPAPPTESADDVHHN